MRIPFRSDIDIPNLGLDSNVTGDHSVDLHKYWSEAHDHASSFSFKKNHRGTTPGSADGIRIDGPDGYIRTCILVQRVLNSSHQSVQNFFHIPSVNAAVMADPHLNDSVALDAYVNGLLPGNNDIMTVLARIKLFRVTDLYTRFDDTIANIENWVNNIVSWRYLQGNSYGVALFNSIIFQVRIINTLILTPVEPEQLVNRNIPSLICQYQHFDLVDAFRNNNFGPVFRSYRAYLVTKDYLFALQELAYAEKDIVALPDKIFVQKTFFQNFNNIVFDLALILDTYNRNYNQYWTIFEEYAPIISNYIRAGHITGEDELKPFLSLLSEVPIDVYSQEFDINLQGTEIQDNLEIFNQTKPIWEAFKKFIEEVSYYVDESQCDEIFKFYPFIKGYRTDINGVSTIYGLSLVSPYARVHRLVHRNITSYYLEDKVEDINVPTHYTIRPSERGLGFQWTDTVIPSFSGIKMDNLAFYSPNLIEFIRLLFREFKVSKTVGNNTILHCYWDYSGWLISLPTQKKVNVTLDYDRLQIQVSRDPANAILDPFDVRNVDFNHLICFLPEKLRNKKGFDPNNDSDRILEYFDQLLNNLLGPRNEMFMHTVYDVGAPKFQVMDTQAVLSMTSPNKASLYAKMVNITTNVNTLCYRFQGADITFPNTALVPFPFYQQWSTPDSLLTMSNYRNNGVDNWTDPCWRGNGYSINQLLDYSPFHLDRNLGITRVRLQVNYFPKDSIFLRCTPDTRTIKLLSMLSPKLGADTNQLGYTDCRNEWDLVDPYSTLDWSDTLFELFNGALTTLQLWWIRARVTDYVFNPLPVIATVIDIVRFVNEYLDLGDNMNSTMQTKLQIRGTWGDLVNGFTNFCQTGEQIYDLVIQSGDLLNFDYSTIPNNLLIDLYNQFITGLENILFDRHNYWNVRGFKYSYMYPGCGYSLLCDKFNGISRKSVNYWDQIRVKTLNLPPCINPIGEMVESVEKNLSVMLFNYMCHILYYTPSLVR